MNGHATNAVGLDAEPPLSARDSDGASAAAPRGRAPGERGGAWDGAPSGDAAADASALRIDLDHRWMDATMQVLEYFTERTPGSWIDVGKSTVRWHWSDSDETFGSSQVQVSFDATKPTWARIESVRLALTPPISPRPFRLRAVRRADLARNPADEHRADRAGAPVSLPPRATHCADEEAHARACRGSDETGVRRLRRRCLRWTR